MKTSAEIASYDGLDVAWIRDEPPMFRLTERGGWWHYDEKYGWLHVEEGYEYDGATWLAPSKFGRRGPLIHDHTLETMWRDGYVTVYLDPSFTAHSRELVLSDYQIDGIFYRALRKYARKPFNRTVRSRAGYAGVLIGSTWRKVRRGWNALRRLFSA